MVDFAMMDALTSHVKDMKMIKIDVIDALLSLENRLAET